MKYGYRVLFIAIGHIVISSSWDDNKFRIRNFFFLRNEPTVNDDVSLDLNDARKSYFQVDTKHEKIFHTENDNFKSQVGEDMNSKEFIESIIKISNEHFSPEGTLYNNTVTTRIQQNIAKIVQNKVKVSNKTTTFHFKDKSNMKDLQDILTTSMNKPDYRIRYHLDPVLNLMRRRRKMTNLTGDSQFRDNLNRNESDDQSLTMEESSSKEMDMHYWKHDWGELWMKKKLNALNSTLPDTNPVNMASARPWGVPCGDPHQADAPWGLCTLGVECDAEFRVYRGDFYCGLNQFVCCSLQLGVELIRGIDPSWEDRSMSTDINEHYANAKRNENEEITKAISRKERSRNRVRIKKKLTKNIEKITKEIKTILEKVTTQGTLARKKKCQLLKKYVKALKQRFKEDRKALKEIHSTHIMYIDRDLTKKLLQLKATNHAFLSNSTFKDIVINGSMTKEGARMLVEAFPRLKPYIPFQFIEDESTNEANVRSRRRFLSRYKKLRDQKYVRKRNSAYNSKYFDYDVYRLYF